MLHTKYFIATPILFSNMWINCTNHNYFKINLQLSSCLISIFRNLYLHIILWLLKYLNKLSHIIFSSQIGHKGEFTNLEYWFRLLKYACKSLDLRLYKRLSFLYYISQFINTFFLIPLFFFLYHNIFRIWIYIWVQTLAYNTHNCKILQLVRIRDGNNAVFVLQMRKLGKRVASAYWSFLQNVS